LPLPAAQLVGVAVQKIVGGGQVHILQGRDDPLLQITFAFAARLWMIRGSPMISTILLLGLMDS
jgi:hypothetical protein